MRKKDVYHSIKITGYVLFIPIALISGPLSGYYLTMLLDRRFDLNYWAGMSIMLLCSLAGILETVRILKRLSRILGEK